MSSPNYHRIQRQVVELGLSAAMPAAEAQERLAREMRDSVNPRIAAIFDTAAGPHELLRLDRLEIDVGTIGGGDWTSQFRERLVERLERELTRYRPEPIGAATPSTAGSPGAQLTRLLLFYMEYGRLPWWGTRPEQGFAAAFEAARAEPDWHAVRVLAQRDQAARARLIDVLGEALLETAVARWIGLPHAALACVALAPPRARATRAWRRAFWLTVLDWAFGDGFHAGRERELVRTLQAVRVTAGAAQDIAGPHDGGATGSAIDDDAVPPQRDMPAPWREWFETAARDDTPDDGRETQPHAERVSLAPRSPTRRDEAARRVQPDADAIADAIYLPCAGVLLVHPFLESLFRERGLLDGRGFRDAEAGARAVYIVGALGFGCAEMPEYDLVIAKLLCGHPFAEPLAPVTLDDTDLAACAELLMAVLVHWQALRSSSVEWLREQFFLRDGKLDAVDSGFRLTVERRAQDVLLARLPWGFGVIRLPWMEQKIFVQWID